MPEGDDNLYAVPDNEIIAATMRGSGLGMREDAYDDYVKCSSVSTPATTAMQPSDGERESGLQVYEDPDNPGPGDNTSLKGKFGH